MKLIMTKYDKKLNIPTFWHFLFFKEICQKVGNLGEAGVRKNQKEI